MAMNLALSAVRFFFLSVLQLVWIINVRSVLFGRIIFDNKSHTILYIKWSSNGRADCTLALNQRENVSLRPKRNIITYSEWEKSCSSLVPPQEQRPQVYAWLKLLNSSHNVFCLVKKTLTEFCPWVRLINSQLSVCRIGEHNTGLKLLVYRIENPRDYHVIISDPSIQKRHIRRIMVRDWAINKP